MLIIRPANYNPTLDTRIQNTREIPTGFFAWIFWYRMPYQFLLHYLRVIKSVTDCKIYDVIVADNVVWIKTNLEFCNTDKLSMAVDRIINFDSGYVILHLMDYEVRYEKTR